MAIGDDATAAGIPLVPGTAAVSKGYEQHNETRDIIAQRTAAVTPILKGGTGATTAPTALIALGLSPGAPAVASLGLTAAKIPSTGNTVQADIDYVNGRAVTALNTANSAKADATYVHQGNMSPAVYSRTVGGNSVYIDSSGLLGHLPSALRFKKFIHDANLDTAAARTVLIRVYQYRAAVGIGDGLQVGVIAEELEAAGFDWLVGYDNTGAPMTVHYDRIGLLALHLAQDAENRLDTLEARVQGLETT